jgi:LEA14-like dessication related protein
MILSKQNTAALCSIILLITLFFPGCALINKRLAIRNCEFRIADAASIKYEPFRDPDKLDITLKIDCRNPDKVMEAVLDRLTFNLLVNGQNTTSGTMNKKLNIPPEAVVQFPVNIRLSLSKVQKVVFDVINSGTATYELRGNAFFSTPIGERSVPVTIAKGSWSGG